MARSPQRAREAVFSKAADALEVDTASMAARWAKAFERRVAERGEPFPIDGLEADVEALVKGIAGVLDDPRTYRSFLGEGENQKIGRSIAEKHVQAGGTLTSALEAYMRLRQQMILASRERFRDSDRPFFDLMTRRRSVRDFSTEAPPRECIELAIRTAASAPSASSASWLG